jgi:hypothetical protein
MIRIPEGENFLLGPFALDPFYRPLITPNREPPRKPGFFNINKGKETNT